LALKKLPSRAGIPVFPAFAKINSENQELAEQNSHLAHHNGWQDVLLSAEFAPVETVVQRVVARIFRQQPLTARLLWAILIMPTG
jgi:hypothetical protein